MDPVNLVRVRLISWFALALLRCGCVALAISLLMFAFLYLTGRPMNLRLDWWIGSSDVIDLGIIQVAPTDPIEPARSVRFDQLPSRGRLIFGVWIVIFYGLYFHWFRHAIGLFTLYRRGTLFSADNVRHFRGIGTVALLIALLKVICAMTLHRWALSNAERVKFWVFHSLATLDIKAIAFAIVIMLIGWVMEEARKLREAEELVI